MFTGVTEGHTSETRTLIQESWLPVLQMLDNDPFPFKKKNAYLKKKKAFDCRKKYRIGMEHSWDS